MALKTTAKTSVNPVNIDDPDDDGPQARTRGAVVRPSEGQRQLAALPGTLDAIGRPVGASRQSVFKWVHGTAVPDDRFRRAIAAHYGIAYSSWGHDTELDGGESEGASDEAEVSADPLEEYRRLIRLVRRQLARGALTARERAQLTDSYTRTLGQMTRLEREREMSEARTIRDHPKWRALKAAIVAALLPHPAASRDVEAAITRVLADESRDPDDA